MQRTKIKDEWVHCECCGHKLMKVVDLCDTCGGKLEIKCHSCKSINLIDFGKEYPNGKAY